VLAGKVQLLSPSFLSGKFMKVLLVGSGGREHAQAWALSRSPLVKQLYAATTNAGINALAKAADADASNVSSLADFAAREAVDLVVIGPEQPLVDGLADALALKGIPAFGPSQAAAQLEGSKVFSKEFMTRHGIPTARYHVVASAEEALAHIGDFGFPVVLKADGLAAGKGVIVAADEAEARAGVHELMVARKVGAAADRVVIEEGLTGRELSYLVFADGKTWRALPVAQDHKRAFDQDRGPNTGGMGAFSAPGLLDAELEKQIVAQIVEPSLAGTAADGFAFKGVLYIGLMLTPNGPSVLEYNVRMGDPETQAILRRLESDFAEICLAVAQGKLDQVQVEWSKETATCIVMASSGYPGSYASGKVIHGLEAAAQLAGVEVFHAGTKRNAVGEVVTAGGRVLGVTARGIDLTAATARAYEAVAQITFDGAFHRSDIGTHS
jgi:phosphoribosylamine---glycine ligase